MAREKANPFRRFSVLATTRSIVIALAVFSVSGLSAARAQDNAAGVESRFREVSDLRSRGEFDTAIEMLSGIIAEFSGSDEVLRRAYNQLVWTLVAKSDDLSERVRLAGDAAQKEKLRAELDAMASRMGEVVGDALTRFHDLHAGDDVPDPSRVNQMYEPARQRMFGNLVVNTTPDSATVWIETEDGEWTHLGFTPLRRNLYPIGSYELRLTKEGHKEVDVASRVGPNETTQHDVTLPRSRGRGWWLTRVGVPALGLAGLTTYLLLNNDSGGTSEPQPLAGPPDPPSP